MIRKIEIQRLTIVSSKPFEVVVAAVENGIGRPDMLEFGKASSGAQTYAELEINDRFKLSQMDLERLGGIPSCIDGFRDDEGDGIADISHLVLCQNRLRRCRPSIEAVTWRREIHRHVRDVGLHQIVCREDQVNPQHAACRVGVDLEVLAMRPGRTDDEAVQHVWGREIVDKLSDPGDETEVLAAQDRLADQRTRSVRHVSLAKCQTVSASTRAPAVRSDGSAHSAGLWLTPSRHGTNSIPV
jgi:hypothetical protein